MNIENKCLYAYQDYIQLNTINIQKLDRIYIKESSR